MAEAVVWTQILNRWLGTSYRVEEVLEMDEEYLAQLRIAMTLADRARKFWGGT